MEAQIKAGGDPYADLLKMSKSDYWKGASAGVYGSNSGDIVTTKFDIEKNQAGGNSGIQWIWGKKGRWICRHNRTVNWCVGFSRPGEAN